MAKIRSENEFLISFKSYNLCRSGAVVLLWFSVARFGVRVSVVFHLACVHIVFWFGFGCWEAAFCEVDAHSVDHTLYIPFVF